MPNRAPQQSQSSKVSIVYVGYFAISLSRIATGLFKSFVMSSSAGVEDFLAQLLVTFSNRALAGAQTRGAARLGAEPGPDVADRVSLARKGYLCSVEFV